MTPSGTPRYIKGQLIQAHPIDCQAHYGLILHINICKVTSQINFQSWDMSYLKILKNKMKYMLPNLKIKKKNEIPVKSWKSNALYGYYLLVTFGFQYLFKWTSLECNSSFNKHQNNN